MDLKKLYREIKNCLKNEQGKLPSNCYFLNDETILALNNPHGDARYPYARDGLVLWAYSSGYISIFEENFYISPLGSEGKEPYLSFFAGLKNKNNKYDYFSINGAGDTLFGRENVEKYTIYTQTSAIYLRIYKKVIYALEISINKNKEIIASIKIENLSNKEVDVYSSSFVNALLIHSNFESEETKWFRKSTIADDGAIIYSVEDVSREIHLHNYMVIKRYAEGDVSTTSTRMLYVGDKNGQLSTSSTLINGKFENEKQVSQFIDMAVYGDIIKKHLSPKESYEAHYKMSLAFSIDKVKELESLTYHKEDNQKDFEELIKENKNNFSKNKNGLYLQVKGLKNTDISDQTFNYFIHQVIKQVDYCCRTKNSSPLMLGVRDVAQMLEAQCMWNPKYVKEKLLFVLNYVYETGRTPRQISQYGENDIALFDSREFIDQGQWLITTTYKYLCYTNDYKFLDEICGYSKYLDFRHAERSKEKDSVFHHLERIINYLISNIDSNTHCLKTLFGDWNDAVDGLGSPEKGSEGFGNGVSIMASFHLYQNLNEFITIASYKGIDVTKYIKAKEELTKGLKEHSFVTKGNEKRIVHGWGNNQSFYVGSFNDVDGESRHSSTSNSFYISSGFYKEDPSLIPSVLEAYKALDSKYGLLTFDIPFLQKNASKVGRIVNLPPGTAENAATYIHAGMYAIKSLSMIKEVDLAYEQMLKLIPLTHKEISTSPFVMPNSYGHNLEIGVDGESMNDWYTGSSNTLLKAFVEAFIGVFPRFDNKIELNVNKLPIEEIILNITIKGHRIKLHQISENNKSPIILIDNKEVKESIIDLAKYQKEINIDIRY